MWAIPGAFYPWFCTKQLLLVLPLVSPLVMGLGPRRGAGIWAVSTAALPLLTQTSGAEARMASSYRCWTGDWPCGSETVFGSQWCWQWNGGSCHPQPTWATSFSSGSPVQGHRVQVNRNSHACLCKSDACLALWWFPPTLSEVCTSEWFFLLVVMCLLCTGWTGWTAGPCDQGHALVEVYTITARFVNLV